MPFPPTEDPKSGLDTISEVFTSFIESKSTLISKVTGEIALLQADWHIIDSTGTIISKGRSSEVLKQRTDGSWVYFIDCPMGLPQV